MYNIQSVIRIIPANGSDMLSIKIVGLQFFQDDFFSIRALSSSMDSWPTIR